MVSKVYDIRDTTKPPRLEIIQWIDHTSNVDQGWKSFSDNILPLWSVHSIGWVIYEDKDKVCLLSTAVRSNNRGFGDITIAKPLITKRYRLKDPST